MYDVISSFEGEFDFLSNFYPSSFIPTKVNLPALDNLGLNYPPVREYATVEHYFQAAKAIHPPTALKIANASSPGKAKRLGRKALLRPGWDGPVPYGSKPYPALGFKYGVMLRGLWYKFSQNADMGEWLDNTGNALLVEGNTWHDNVWGHCFCKKCENIAGQNLLGKALMEIRGELAKF